LIKPGRILFIVLCLCLLAGSASDLLPKAYAASSMTASESCIDFIRKIEGFSAKPYYDYGQHTVGYGTKCPTDKYFDYMANGIPISEAESLLRENLADVENAINTRLIDKYQLVLNQHQFDALVSFSFNTGTGWMSYDSTMKDAILRSANADDVVYAFGLYCTAGGNYSSALITRRLCESNMYLNGIYSHTKPDDYGYVFYEPNGGSLTYQVQAFICESHPAPVADAVRSEDVFLGWYTDIIGGTQVSELSKALSGKTLFARWQSSKNAEEDSPSMIIHVTGDVVNIRKGPGTNYGIAKQVYRNDTLIVSHVTDLSNRKWGKVQDGWICLDYTNYDALLHGTDDTVPDANPPQNDGQANIDDSHGHRGIVRVNDLLRIRSGPGTNYTTVGYLYDGNPVDILEQRATGAMVWGRITRGWVCMDYIITDGLPTDSKTEPEQNTETEQDPSDFFGNVEVTQTEGRIIADALRIRSQPGTGHSIVGFYYYNDVVTVSQKVLVDSVYWGKTDQGWIHMDYFQAGSSAEETLPSNENTVKTVIADCLRVRKDTSTDSRISALLYYGDQVTVLETKTVDGTVWGRVSNGWICMDYVN